MSTDPVLNQLRNARPMTAADQGEWASSAAGMTALAHIHQSVGSPVAAPRRRVGRAVGIGAAVVVIGASVAAFTVTHHRTPTVANMVLCNQTSSLTASGSGLTVPDTSPATAIAACSQQWGQMYPGTTKPAAFAACVYPASAGQAGGVIVVLPTKVGLTNDQACIAAGADLIG